MSPEYLDAVFNTTVRLVSAAWPYAILAQRHSIGRRPICEALVPSILRLQELYNSFVLPDKLCSAELVFAKLLTGAACHVHSLHAALSPIELTIHWVFVRARWVRQFLDFLDVAQLCLLVTERTFSIHRWRYLLRPRFRNSRDKQTCHCLRE